MRHLVSRTTCSSLFLITNNIADFSKDHLILIPNPLSHRWIVTVRRIRMDRSKMILRFILNPPRTDCLETLTCRPTR
jgi:hypothetical protein